MKKMTSIAIIKVILQITLIAAFFATHTFADSITFENKTPFPKRAFIGFGAVPLELKLKTSNEFKSQAVTVQISIKDADGKIVQEFKDIVQLKPNTENWMDIAYSFKPDKFGYYSVQAQANDAAGKLLTKFATGIGILRPLTERQKSQSASESIFGVNTHYDQGKGDLATMPELMYMAGIRWVRDSISWSGVERAKGKYEIPEYLMSSFEILSTRYNMSLLGVLCYDNKFYKHGTMDEVAGYKNYAKWVAGTLKGIVDHFEIWNEPNGFASLTPKQYAEILKVGYLGVKGGNRNAFVVGIGGSTPGGWSGDYLYGVHEVGAIKYMDTFSIHPYTSPYACDIGYKTYDAPHSPRAGLDTGLQCTHGFQDILKQARGFSKKTGIWITEMGWPTTHAGFMGQAQQIARMYTVSAAMPDVYSKVFLYDFLCDGTKPDEKEDNFGIVGYDYSIRPAYVAMATTSRAIDGRKFIRRITHPDESVRLYLFGPQDNPMLVAWVTEISPSELITQKLRNGKPIDDLSMAGSRLDYKLPIKLRIKSEGVILRDWQDRERRLKVVDGILNLELSTWPVFISGLESSSIGISK